MCDRDYNSELKTLFFSYLALKVVVKMGKEEFPKPGSKGLVLVFIKEGYS